MFLLEIIVTSLEDAIEAEAGGADRLELVSHLEHGGLTPPIELAQQIVERIAIPLRVMVRESCHMQTESVAENRRLRAAAASLSRLCIDGLVLGFAKQGALDLVTTAEVLADARETRATFHRAIDEVDDSSEHVGTLRQMPQFDRVLTNGGSGTWQERKSRLERWREVLAPEIKLIFAAGDDLDRAPELIGDSGIREVHFGRAARTPPTVKGAVDRSRVAALRETFARGHR